MTKPLTPAEKKVIEEEKAAEKEFQESLKLKKVDPVAEQKKVETEANKEIMDKMTAILNEHGNLESNIPLTSEYWVLKNQVK